MADYLWGQYKWYFGCISVGQENERIIFLPHMSFPEAFWWGRGHKFQVL